VQLVHTEEVRAHGDASPATVTVLVERPEDEAAEEAQPEAA
jgi:hypothetical protein